MFFKKSKPIIVTEADGNTLISYKCKKKLYSKQSPYQKVEVFETMDLGRMLMNDDIVMVSERDEFVYHDMIAHVPLFTHPNPKNVLIIGGGDGGTAREVLRHKNVETCDMVEIDEAVVESCREFITQTSSVFSNPKLNLMIADGIDFVKNTKKKYEVILVDSTDPIGPAIPLFGLEFYQTIHNALTSDGIVVSQAESPFRHIEQQKRLIETTRSLFPKVYFYNYANMTYPSGLWSFMFSSKKYSPYEDFQKERYESSQMEFKYYNKDIHKACFALPSFMKKELNL